MIFSTTDHALMLPGSGRIVTAMRGETRAASFKA